MLEPIAALDSLGQGEVENVSSDDEDQLVALAKTDTNFFGEIYDRYYGRILNYIYRRTLVAAEAEEITSATFLKALRALPEYEPRGKFSAWLYRIAGNEIKLYWRTKRRRRDENAIWREDYARLRFAAAEVTTTEVIEEQARLFARLHDALRRLPEPYQAVLALRYFEGMSYDEVAEVLEEKLGTVKSLIHRGLKRLRRQLDGNDATLWQEQHCQVREERQP